MAQVTVQSGGYVSVPGSGTDVVALQTQIATALNSAAGTAGVNFYTASLTGGGAAPTPPGAATVTEAYITNGTGGQAYTVGSAYQYVVVNQSGGGADTITLAPNQDVISGTVGGHFVGVGADTVALGGGNNVFSATLFGAFPQADYVVGGSGNDTIFDANGGTLDGGGGTNLLGSYSTAGAVQFISSGVNDTVVAFTSSTGSATVDASGTRSLIFGDPVDTGTLLVQDTGSNDTVVGGAGSSTISAGGSNLLVGGGAGNMLFLGGAGSATVLGHAGENQTVDGGSGHILYSDLGASATINGGSAAVTVFGGASGSVTYNSSIGGVVFQALSGNETLNASGSSTGNLIAAANSLLGNPQGTGADSLVGGSGNDTFFGGNGSATMTGGSGSNTFAFFKFLGTGNDVITDYTSSDSVFMTGYGSNQGAAIASSTSSGSNTTVTLSDNTTIKFLGVSSINTLQGHLFFG